MRGVAVPPYVYPKRAVSDVHMSADAAGDYYATYANMLEFWVRYNDETELANELHKLHQHRGKVEP